ncbi:hypothetical protein PROFUN_06910 [Planoprotostelium fungivorum]|uniref:Inhibitor of growth protein n=1 Tax=Planoprotostelium fungivorum TaxID=1890364 RepID=A0A2P6NN41_9EUKA|nr:hypothetical protein PROFUN_06910 [Planoprotostelium fungivorum]
MGTYLENYLEGVSSLPQEVRRGFALLRDLDNRSQELLDRIEVESKTSIKNYKRKRDPSSEEQTSIRNDLKQCLELADEKIQLAVQTYELVDKHIRKLDQDLKKFEAELQAEQTMKDAVQPGQAPVEKKEKEPVKSRKKTPAVENILPAVDPKILTVEIDMPIDPNEPTYCTCNRVSFGEMVGCDNPDCKIEWFHYECVGLTAAPKGKWYCADCTRDIKEKKKAR